MVPPHVIASYCSRALSAVSSAAAFPCAQFLAARARDGVRNGITHGHCRSGQVAKRYPTGAKGGHGVTAGMLRDRDAGRCAQASFIPCMRKDTPDTAATHKVMGLPLEGELSWIENREARLAEPLLQVVGLARLDHVRFYEGLQPHRRWCAL